MKRIFTVWTCWLIACFAFALPAVAQTNYFRIEHPDNSNDGQAFPTWTEAITYLNEQPELEDGKAYKILVIQKSGAKVDAQEYKVLMPNKAALISCNAISTTNKYELEMEGTDWKIQAPLTFDKVKLSINNEEHPYQSVYANGHRLEFTSNVDVDYYIRLKVYGGSFNKDVESTEVILNGGKFLYVFGGNYTGNVGTTCVKIGGEISTNDRFLFIYGGGESDCNATKTQVLIGDGAEIVTGSVFGGNMYNGEIGESLVEISGTAKVGSSSSIYVYAAGENGHVNKATLEINGNPTIGSRSTSYYLYGGSLSGTVDNTYVNISGGSFNKQARKDGSIHGGCYAGIVNEDTHINISGGTNIYRVWGGNTGQTTFDEPTGEVLGMAHIEISGGKISEVYGGSSGYGSKGVGAVDIQIKGGEIDNIYGGGESSKVGDISIAMEGGTVKDLFLLRGLSGTSPATDWTIAGKSTVRISDGSITNLGAIRQTGGTKTPLNWNDELPVDFIIEGDKASITNFNAYATISLTGDEWKLPFKSSTLTFKDCGTAASPYYLNSDIALFTKVVTENSFVNMGTNSFVVKEEYPLTISGKTWQMPQGKFKLKSWDNDFNATELSANDVIVELEGNDFTAEDFSFDDGEKELYKVGNSIRYNDGSLEDDDFHLVAITNEESEKGSLSVVWDGTVVNSGDKVPQIEGLPLIATVTPEEGYSGTVFVNDEPQTGSSVEIACDEDKTFKATFAENPYTITYTQPENGTITVTDAEDAVITTGSTALFNSLNTITVTPNTGYQLQEGSLKATYGDDGNLPVALTPVEGQAGKYTFTMPAGAVTITATFEKATYQVTLSEVEGGSIKADKATAQMGDEVTLAYEANTNYEFVAWTVTDGSQQAVEVTAEEEGKYTFIMPASDVTVTAIFEKEEDPEPPVDPISYYNIYVEDVCDGVEVSTSKQVVREGGSITVYVEKDTARYTFDNFKVYYKRSYYGYWEELKEGTQPGEYPIHNIWTHIYIKAEGAEEIEDPTGIESIEGVKVYTKDGSLCVQTSQREVVIIVSMSGAVVKNEEQVGLKQYHGLQPGIYIVRVGDRAYKVRLN